MHAASVHPEPGSNSRKYSIYSPFGLHINLSSFCSALLLFCKSFIFSLESRVPCTSVYNFLSTFYFVLSLALIYLYMMCCSIFKDQILGGLIVFRAALLADSLYIIPLVFTLVKWFFKVFLSFFQLFLTLFLHWQVSRLFLSRLLGDPVILPLLFPFVKYFWGFF